MSVEGWITLGTIALIALALVRNLAGPDMILLGGLALLVTISTLTPWRLFDHPAQAVTGFGNEGLVTVGALFIVVSGLSQTGAMQLIVQPLLGKPKTIRGAQARLMLPTAGLSAFLNNTPIVAMFMPVVNDWTRKTGISPSKLFIPLSYAAILGGTCTLIGTSTNLIVNGLLRDEAGHPGIGMFDLAWVGLPAAVVGITYVLIASRWLLPDRRDALSAADDPRQYTVEMLVDPGSPLAGQTIEQAGLRHLPGLYLVEIERDGDILPAVGPQQVLREGDRLVFVGIIESVVDLRKMRGLSPATNQLFKLDAPRSNRRLVEAVVSNSCPLIGKTIRQGRFRSTYNAAVIAVAREGQRVDMKIGDIRLQPGDTLLLEASPAFEHQQRNSRDFFLVSTVQDSTPPRHERAWVALGILALMVTLVTIGWMPMLAAALAAAAGMIATRCCTGGEARRSIDWSVLLVIGSAIGIAQALANSGAATTIAHGMLNIVGPHPWPALVVIYFTTMLFTGLITNNAAAVLMFPIAFATAGSIDANPLPFAIAIMLAASNDFATPIGYQTNLMVYGPGGYRFTDYLRFGIPLNIMVFTIAVLLIPMVWGF